MIPPTFFPFLLSSKEQNTPAGEPYVQSRRRGVRQYLKKSAYYGITEIICSRKDFKTRMK